MDCGNTVSTLLLHNDPDYVLFKIAIDFAEQGLSTWFIAIAPCEKIPENIQQPCKEVLQLITFIYIKDFLDLVKHFNGIHKWKNIPNFIILRDFDKYCSLNNVQYNSTQTAFLSTTLLDSITYLARKKDYTTLLLICCSNLNGQKIIEERVHILYDMYFKNLLVRNNFESEDHLIDDIKKEFSMNKTTHK